MDSLQREQPFQENLQFSGLVFHHIGVVCKSITDEEKYFLSLGYTRDGGIFTDLTQKITGLFMTLGPMRVELLEPATNDSPLNGFIRKEIKTYHQAFKCENLIETVDLMKTNGAFVVVSPTPADGFGRKRISFLMFPNKMLIELVEN